MDEHHSHEVPRSPADSSLEPHKRHRLAHVAHDALVGRTAAHIHQPAIEAAARKKDLIHYDQPLF